MEWGRKGPGYAEDVYEGGQVDRGVCAGGEFWLLSFVLVVGVFFGLILLLLLGSGQVEAG